MKKKKKAVRRMISLPEEVHDNMLEYKGENWSAIAVRAFQCKLAELKLDQVEFQEFVELEDNPTEFERIEAELCRIGPEIDNIRRRVEKLEKYIPALLAADPKDCEIVLRSLPG